MSPEAFPGHPVRTLNLRKLIPLYLGAAVGPMGGVGIVTLLPVLAGLWRVDFSTASLAITFYMIPFVVAQLFSGPIAQLFDARKALLFGFALYAVGGAACGISQDLWTLMVSRAAQGIGAAFLTPIIMALVGEMVEERDVGKAMGLLGMAYTVGVTLGPLISGFIEVRYGWATFFFFLAGLSLCSGILYLLSSEPTRSRGRAETRILDVFPVLKDALFRPGVLHLSFAAFSYFIAYIGIMTFTADYLKTQAGLPSDRIGMLISSTGFTGIAVSPVAGYLGDRLGRLKVFWGGAGIALVCIVIMNATAFSYWAYFVLFLVFGTGSAVAWTSLNTMGVQIQPLLRKPVASVYNAVKFAGYAFSPVVLSMLYVPYHLPAVQWGCVGAIAASGVLAWRAVTAAGQCRTGRGKRLGIED